MQEKITEKTHILDEQGHVIRPGWSNRDVFIYEREKIAKSSLRIKEWDYWEVFNDQARVIFNIYDIGYLGVAEYSILDFNTKESYHAQSTRLFTRGSIGSPSSWQYDEPLVFKKKKNTMIFDRNGDNILLSVDFQKEGIKGEFTLYKDPKMDIMVNLIPFEDPRQFVYVVKIMCMPAKGEITKKNKKYVFNESNNSWGILDWTRAVFPYKNHWKWSVSSGKVNGVNFGFNLDYGFGTESSKSMIFYDGVGHHLDEVYYQHDKKNLKKPLKITSPDDRVNLVLKPKCVDKHSINYGILYMKGFNTYGYFTGEVVLDDGTVVEIKEKDKLFGWAEEFSQKW